MTLPDQLGSLHKVVTRIMPTLRRSIHARVEQVLDQLMSRASVRDFSDRPVEPDVLDQILLASVNSPSGGNLQPYSINVIEDDERRKHVAEMCFQGFIAKAPVLLLYCLDLHRNEVLAEHGIAPYPASRQKVRPKFPLSIMAHTGEYHEPDIETLVSAYDAREQGRTYRPTVKNIEQIVETARNVGRDELAVVVEKSIEEAGSISPINAYGQPRFHAQDRGAGILLLPSVRVAGRVGVSHIPNISSLRSR